MSFKFSSILSSVDCRKCLIMAWIIWKFIKPIKFVTFKIFFLATKYSYIVNLYEQTPYHLYISICTFPYTCSYTLLPTYIHVYIYKNIYVKIYPMYIISVVSYLVLVLQIQGITKHGACACEMAGVRNLGVTSIWKSWRCTWSLVQIEDSGLT